MNKFVRKMLNSRVPYLLLPLLSCVPADANILNTSSAPATSVQSTAENTYVAGNNSVQQLFFVIGGVLISLLSSASRRRKNGYPVILTSMTRNRYLTPWPPVPVLSGMTTEARFTFTTAAKYKAASCAWPLHLLTGWSLTCSHRACTIRDSHCVPTDAPGSFYVSGPPVYVELVSAAAKYIDATYARPGTGETTIRVIKLKNSFVNDRNYTQRDVPVTVPGVATVLNQLLNNTSSREGGRSAPAGRILPLITIRAARWKRPLRRKR
jgi:type III secretion protein C